MPIGTAWVIGVQCVFARICGGVFTPEWFGDGPGKYGEPVFAYHRRLKLAPERDSIDNYSVYQLYVLQVSTMGKPASGILRRNHRKRLCDGLVQ